MDEFELIKNYFQKISINNPGARKLNDDVFFDKNRKLVVSIDTYNEGIHFPNFKYPKLVIKKVIRSSISDLIAKGVKPKYYFISGCGSRSKFSKKNLKIISKSLNQEQKKYDLKLSGGDTTNSTKVSFSITSIGFSKKIIERNKARLNDDIYVTGNIGDSFIGLKVIKKNIKINSKLKKYFVNQFYCPNLPYKIYKEIHKFANTSIDISDGLIADMNKLINKQKLSFEINVNKIPISKNLEFYLKKYKKLRTKYLFNGDDYQVLFTAPQKMRYLIKSVGERMNQKFTIIGKINNGYKKNSINLDNKPLNLSKFKGYSHKF
ncbi:thiamine-phosphate kinase [Candidatus Pelagibacter sp.]|nr:thiamine-phosphate kinase [Candidatus Pelagibacter sp.]